MRKITKRESCFASLLVSFELSTLGQKKKKKKKSKKQDTSILQLWRETKTLRRKRNDDVSRHAYFSPGVLFAFGQ